MDKSTYNKNYVRCNAFSQRKIEPIPLVLFPKKIDGSFLWSIISYKNGAIKCSKLGSETTRLLLFVPLELNIF